MGPQIVNPHCCRVLRSDPPWDWLRLTQVLCSSLCSWEHCNCSTQMRWGVSREPHHTRGRLTPQESFELLLTSWSLLRIPKPCISTGWTESSPAGLLFRDCQPPPGSPKDWVRLYSSLSFGPILSSADCLGNPCLVESQERVHLNRVYTCDLSTQMESERSRRYIVSLRPARAIGDGGWGREWHDMDNTHG